LRGAEKLLPLLFQVPPLLTFAIDERHYYCYKSSQQGNEAGYFLTLQDEIPPEPDGERP
jgi:hypothetical protein